MRFLLDMNMPVGFAEQLQAEGHEAVHAGSIGYRERADAEIFSHADHNNQIVVTLDLDFADIAASGRSPRPSVILLRLRSIRRSSLWDRLMVTIAETETALLAGAIVIVEDARIRIRRMPIEE